MEPRNLKCRQCGEENPRGEFHEIRWNRVCRSCLEKTEWNLDPDWPAYLEQFASGIRKTAAARCQDAMLRKDAEQAAWVRLFQLKPQDSDHYDRFVRGEIDAEEFGRILGYMVNRIIHWAIHSAVTRRDSRRLGTGHDPIHEPWPDSPVDADDEHLFDPPDGRAQSADELGDRIDYRKMVRSPLLTPIQRDSLIMWSCGYRGNEIGAILGYKYGSRPLTGATVSYHRNRAIKTLRGQYGE